MSLLLLPANRKNLRKSIDQSVDLKFVQQFLSDDFINQIIKYSGIEGIRCWAMTKNSEHVFDKISIGDEVLFSEKNTGLFNYYAVVIGKIINYEFGPALWTIAGDSPWDHIFFLANITKVVVSKRAFVKQLGYAENFAVQGPVIVSDEKYNNIGSISQQFSIPLYDKVAEANVDKDFAGESVECIGTRRIGHSKFSKDVKTNYGYSCAVCGINEVEFLVSSHISPWYEDVDNRLNPSNGICLCSMHDKAFEHGFIGINDTYQIILSSHLNKSSLLCNELKRFEGKQINLPKVFPPDKNLLSKHREKNNLTNGNQRSTTSDNQIS
jgi:hypothetical protein